LIAVIVAVAGGGTVVIPSLLVLLRLSVAGRLGDYSADGGSVDPRNGPVRTAGSIRPAPGASPPPASSAASAFSPLPRSGGRTRSA
jgi:hypothetical protein